MFKEPLCELLTDEHSAQEAGLKPVLFSYIDTIISNIHLDFHSFAFDKELKSMKNCVTSSVVVFLRCNSKRVYIAFRLEYESSWCF